MSTQQDIVYMVHQCAKLSEDLQTPHGEAVKRVGNYLQGTGKLGV